MGGRGSKINIRSSSSTLKNRISTLESKMAEYSKYAMPGRDYNSAKADEYYKIKGALIRKSGQILELCKVTALLYLST